MKFKSEIYTIKALTNMHVGSGDVSYNIVDNTVQRDPVYETPVIHSSSLKGALREFFKQETEEKVVETVFGSTPHGQETTKSQPGKYRFFTAHLLSLPVRSNVKPYFTALSPGVLDRFINLWEDFSIPQQPDDLCKIEDLKAFREALGDMNNKGPFVFRKEEEEIYLEDLKAVAFPRLEKVENLRDKMEALLGPNLAVFNDDDFKELCRELPVVARNYLENGKSENLWYEEILPHQSLFYTVILKEEGEGIPDLNFEVKGIQIGAGATIGWGFSAFRRVVG